jgi:hypothetical protein
VLYVVARAGVTGARCGRVASRECENAGRAREASSHPNSIFGRTRSYSITFISTLKGTREGFEGYSAFNARRIHETKRNERLTGPTTKHHTSNFLLLPPSGSLLIDAFLLEHRPVHDHHISTAPTRRTKRTHLNHNLPTRLLSLTVLKGCNPLETIAMRLVACSVVPSVSITIVPAHSSWTTSRPPGPNPPDPPAEPSIVPGLTWIVPLLSYRQLEGRAEREGRTGRRIA